MYDNIFKTIKIRHLEIKNRIVFSPTSMSYDRETYLQKLINIAKGGVGLIVIGDVSVVGSLHRGGTLSDDAGVEYFKTITNEVHKYDCKISAQLFHPDYDIDSIKQSLVEKKVDRQQIRTMMKNSMYNYVNELTREDIIKIQDKFAKAACRAKQAGFDMVQVHGDRLLGSFSSSIFNKREDEYGGSVENRAKMSVEIVKKIRAEICDMPIDYKLGIRKENPDLGKGGPTLKETEAFVHLLDDAGVDSFHVSIANHSFITDTIPAFDHKHLAQEGCFIDLAKQVKQYTDKVVCGVGKLKTPEFIDSLLEADIDMVGLSRQLIADDQWVLKIEQGRENDIDYCRFCNVKCTNSLMSGAPFGCVLHHTNTMKLSS